MIVIPAIDLYQGRCVRLYQGRYDQVTFYQQHPVELAQRYKDAGVTVLHLVDLDGARDELEVNHHVISQIASIPGLLVQSGGGIRNEDDIRKRFDMGIDRVVIGSLAVSQPDTVQTWLKRYGRETITLALDVRFDQTGTPRLATQGWTQQSDVSLWDCLAQYGNALEHVLCTDIARDGALSGPSTDLYGECVRRFAALEFQASGGVRNLQDIKTLDELGLAGVVSGKALLEEQLTLQEIEPFLPNA